jgi:hypothetical protein
VEDAVGRQAELFEILLAAAREIDWLRHEAHGALESQDGENPKTVLARIGARRRAVESHESDAEIRLADVANQARALVRRMRSDPGVESREIVRALEAIVEAAEG